MDTENQLQLKNRNVVGIGRENAPDLNLYPEGYVDTLKLPAVLTWVISTVLDTSATIQTDTVQIDVFVQVLGQSIVGAIKKACKDLRDLFVIEYAISAANMIISDDPYVRIVPGSIEIGGYRDVVNAPDESPYHGFTITLTVEGHVNVTCT